MESKQVENCKVTVVGNEPCAVSLSVEVPHAAVAKETEAVFDEIQKGAQLPGFRAGKAPQDMVRKAYTGTAREKVIEGLIHKTVFEALKSQGINPIDVPLIDKVTFDFDKPFQYTLKAERHPEFKVKDYKGIKITKTIVPVTDAKVRENMDVLRERNARLEPSASDTVGPAHIVALDYECFLDGQPVADLKTKNFVMDLSAQQLFPGLKEGIVGAKKSESRDVPVSVPADYPAKHLAGKNVVFKVVINEIKEKVLPALDDEFAKDMGFETVAALETKVKESLETEEQQRQHQEVEKQILSHLLAKNEFPVPASLVDSQLARMWERTLEYFRSRGVPQQKLDQEKKQWMTKYRGEAENTVRVSYILSAVAAAENIEVTADELTQEKTRMSAANPGREQDAEKYFEENKSSIETTLREEKIFAFLLGAAQIKEAAQK